MRRFTLAALLVVAVNNSSAQDAAERGQPCTSASRECTEWVTLPGSSSRALVYRTYSLNARNEDVTHALLMVHGGSRNADDYFRTALTPTFLAGRLHDTVVIAPRFAANDGQNCTDEISGYELNFPCGGQTWYVGSAAENDADVTAYDVIDELLSDLARKETFPNLSEIVVAGHSAGGVFVSHYQMTNMVHEELGLPTTYVAANAGYYAYLDALRPTETAFPVNVAATAPGFGPQNSGDSSPAFETFPDADNCTAYNNWPYGLQKRSGYSSRLSDEKLKGQLVERPMIYLLGALDVRRVSSPCSRLAQGPNRLAVGFAYGKYVNEKHGADHEIVVVGGCGHNHRCMFSSDTAGPIIFPEN